ncbi:MAG TPA: Hsp20/alpha crystallin family protein [Thermoanaerobaculia bacterium]|nr:Hsp20/alpha crystallin family protein [Thermoanaerobaculia bacterium]
MTVFRWNSLQDLFAIQEKVNRLFEETIHRTEFPDEGIDAALWSPAADVYESPDEIVLNIELPGVRLEDVRLEALEGKIRVAGHRRADDGIEPRHFVRMERIYGSFSRDFPVPVSIDPGLIKASLRAGVLRVVAPKADRGQPIPVDTRKAR